MANAKLHLNGTDYDLPVFDGTEGETAVDIGSLRGASGAITFDPGYGNTGSCKSAITFIDGEKGILRHRGYTIEDLAEKASFTEVCWLVINGELPTDTELNRFEEGLGQAAELGALTGNVVEQFDASAHPMTPLIAGVGAMAALYGEDDDIHAHFHRLLAQSATIAAHFYRHANGKKSVAPDSSRSYAGNFLHMMFGETPTEAQERALNTLLILHADHEQNCSASTVRMVGSSDANVYASIVAGLCALWGPRHGGANQAVIEMLDEISADGGDLEKYVARAKDKDDEFKLMGFGHRVYTNFDPRARIIKKYCDELLDQLGIEDPQLELARGLEKVALSDDYFADRKLYPNVDFYSGIIYKALGIPTNFFTVLFAIGRMPGWLAQWKEMKEAGDRIHRPRQIYIGKTKRAFPR